MDFKCLAASLERWMRKDPLIIVIYCSRPAGVQSFASNAARVYLHRDLKVRLAVPSRIILIESIRIATKQARISSKVAILITISLRYKKSLF